MYVPLAGVCLPVNVCYKDYAMLAIPFIFDVVIIALTAFRTYHLVTAMHKETSAKIV